MTVIDQIMWRDPRATKHDWTVDMFAAGLAVLFTAVPYVMMVLSQLAYSGYFGVSSLEMIVAAVAALIFSGAMALRRHYPFGMLALMGLGGVLMVVGSPVPMLPIVLVPIAAYSIARWIGGDRARWVVWLGLFGSVVGPWRWMMVNGMGGSFGGLLMTVFLALVCLGFVVTPYAIGRRVADLARGREIQEERQTMMIAAQRQQSTIAEAQSRNLIARELHDIVAHSVSVMVVQAEGGRALAAKRPEAALEALDTIAESGREALTEMRRIVGVLRQGPGARTTEYGPAPSLGDIAELVHRSGEQVSLEISGAQPNVSPAVGLTIYRVVQEAITNALKHAGPGATIAVKLDYRPGQITAEVRDDGLGGAAPTDGQGHGLQGMHERVASMGGQLLTQPLSAGGFLVRAQVPLAGAQRFQQPPIAETLR